jgi:hypothetical protein
MFTITKTIALVAMSLLAFSSSILYSYALPKDPKWGKEGYCLDAGEPLSGQKYLTCCWKEIGPSPDASEAETEVTRCQTCWYDVNGQPDNCGDVYEPRHNEEVSPGTPPTEGVSDDPKSGDNPNPGIPPTGGVVVDETENQNSGNENENENDDTPSNTIPRKGGDLDASDLRENVIGH